MTSEFNLVDLMNLPVIERSIMRLVLRKVTMTYPQLREAATERRMDRARLDAALEHLTRIHWLTREVSNYQIVYRVNTSGKSSDAPERKQSLGLQRTENFLTMQRGGKRLLPDQIWDRINDAETSKDSTEPSSTKTASHRGLLNKLTDDSTSEEN